MTTASRPSLLRHASLWLSFTHAVVVLILVPIAMLGQAYAVGEAEVWGDVHAKEFDSLTRSEQVWRLFNALMRTRPSRLHEFISGFAGVYYIVDLLLIWLNVHPIDLTLKLWYSLHHLLCFVGLTAPTFWWPSTWDTNLAYVGFFTGEISNPPRCIVDLLQYQIDTQPSAAESRPIAQRYVTLLGRQYSARALLRAMATAARFHLGLFIAFRFIGLKFWWSFLMPNAQLDVTRWMGGTTLALSLMAMVVMIQGAMNAKPIDEPVVTKKVQ